MYPQLWLLVAGFILIVAVALYQIFRKWIFGQKLFGKGNWKRVAERLDSYLLYGVFVCYFIIFVGLAALVYFVFGEQELLSGFVLGAIVVSFMIFELQRLAKPNIFVVSCTSPDGRMCGDIPLRRVDVKVGQRSLLFFIITNIGLNNYQNCMVWFSFPEGLTPLGDANIYHGVDFRKDFQLQKKTNTVFFLPTDNYQSLPPGVSIYFPIWIEASRGFDSANKEVKVSLTSETKRGEALKKLPVRIV